MTPDPQHASAQPGGDGYPAAETGNASNPSPQNKAAEQPSGNQLLDAGAEKYLREVANIEDVPDAQEQQDMDKTIEQVRNESSD